MKRFAAALALACAAVLVGGPLGHSAQRIRRSWAARVAVEGASMEPALHAGEWLLVDPDGYRDRDPAVGDLVVAPDPRQPDRWLVKRVRAVDPIGWLELAGDRPESSTDSRTFGPVDPATVTGRPWFRCWPPGRIGGID